MTTQNNRQAFTFYRSFYDAIKTLPSTARLELYDAILSLSFDESEPSFSLATSRRFWSLIKPNLLTSLKNWKNGCQPKRSDAASQNEATPISKNKIEIKKKNIEKERLGENQKVTLSLQEISKLKQYLGELDFKEYLTRLDLYIMQVGDKYKSHYATILTWYRKDHPEKKPQKEAIIL